MDNLPRVLPRNCDAVILKGSWDVLPIFQIIAERGGVPEPELYQVFNNCRWGRGSCGQPAANATRKMMQNAVTRAGTREICCNPPAMD